MKFQKKKTIKPIVKVASTDANEATIYYCEIVESILIDNHQAQRNSNVIGVKFKMQVLHPKRLPGGGLKFSEGSPVNGEFIILNSWGGVNKIFVANETSGNGTASVHFNNGYVTYVTISDLSIVDGPVAGITSSATCDKF